LAWSPVPSRAWFITYYGDRGGDWLVEIDRKMKTVAQSDGSHYETRHVQTY
jgi:hypothetical protein